MVGIWCQVRNWTGSLPVVHYIFCGNITPLIIFSVSPTLKNKTQIHVTVLLQFCHILSHPRKRRRKVLPLDCPNVISAHSSVPASGPAERKDAAEEGCDEGALIDKLNYQQSRNPWAFFFFFILHGVKSLVL